MKEEMNNEILSVITDLIDIDLSNITPIYYVEEVYDYTTSAHL